eukprot:1684740-Pyramimonas_sp.AAC.1
MVPKRGPRSAQGSPRLQVDPRPPHLPKTPHPYGPSDLLENTHGARLPRKPELPREAPRQPDKGWKGAPAYLEGTR